MLNQVILVGRIASELNVLETEDDKKRASILLAVNRSYKNADGKYDTDFINCILWNGIATNTAQYCKVGDIIGVKGKLRSNNYQDENGKTHYVTEVVAEKVTFLSSNQKEKSVEKDM